MTNKMNYTKPLFFISIIFFILISLFFFIQWQNLNENIKEIKEQNRMNYEKILNKKDYGPFQIEYKKLNDKQVIIDPKEIEKINNHIKVLTEEVYKESNRNERITDKDLDRLNLYMAIGIGFMTILGIFIPILVNILSTQDLRGKINNISEKFEEIEKQKPEIDKAIKDSNSAIENATKALTESEKVSELSAKINEVQKKTEMVIPEVYNLVLQNSISRFFNISPIVLTNAIRYQNFQDFINLLIPIRNGFEELKTNNSFEIEKNTIFKNTINDFILFLQTERFRFQSIFSKKLENKKFDNLILCLDTLGKSTKENKVQNFERITIQLEEIIEIFKRKNVKDKPAA